MSSTTAPNTLLRIASSNKAALFIEIVEYLDACLDVSILRDTKDNELAATFLSSVRDYSGLDFYTSARAYNWSINNNRWLNVMASRSPSAIYVADAANTIFGLTTAMLKELGQHYKWPMHKERAVNKIVGLNERAWDMKKHWSSHRA